MDGFPCRTCVEDCGAECLALQRARLRERDASFLTLVQGVVRDHRAVLDLLAKEDVW